MSNFSSWVENLFGSPVVQIEDAKMTRAWERYQEPLPRVLMTCGCGNVVDEGECNDDCRKRVSHRAA